MLKLSAPWCTYYKMIASMFQEDPEVQVIYQEEGVIKLLTKNALKASALKKLLPTEKSFGNVRIVIDIQTIRDEQRVDNDLQKIISDAFEKNTAVSRIEVVTNIFEDKLCFVVFKPVVVHFFNDDISDINGCCHTLYADIAKEIFEITDVFFCTDLNIIDNSKGETNENSDSI